MNDAHDSHPVHHNKTIAAELVMLVAITWIWATREVYLGCLNQAVLPSSNSPQQHRPARASAGASLASSLQRLRIAKSVAIHQAQASHANPMFQKQTHAEPGQH